MGPSRSRFPDSTHGFAQYLYELKGSGSNLLVTGDVPEAVTARATEILFGQGQRYRVLALLDTASRIPDLFSDYEDHLWIIEQSGEKRSVPSATPSEETRKQVDDIDAVRREISAAIDLYDETAGGLDPSELRVGVDLSGKSDVRRVRPFLEKTTALVMEYQGMAHYHLPVSDDDPVVENLSPLFDARIELRQEPGQPPEQRWQVPEFEETPMWVRL